MFNWGMEWHYRTESPLHPSRRSGKEEALTAVVPGRGDYGVQTVPQCPMIGLFLWACCLFGAHQWLTNVGDDYSLVLKGHQFYYYTSIVPKLNSHQPLISAPRFEIRHLDNVTNDKKGKENKISNQINNKKKPYYKLSHPFLDLCSFSYSPVQVQ